MTSSKPSFPAALRSVRKARGLSQEAFSDVSSRTYLSSIERGIKVPTITKVEQLCEVLGVHPLTLYALSFSSGSSSDDKVLAQVQNELSALRAQMKKKSGAE